MPKKCKKTIIDKLPEGIYPVVQYKRQILYIEVGDQVIALPNPFPFVPLAVAMKETADGWEILNKE